MTTRSLTFLALVTALTVIAAGFTVWLESKRQIPLEPEALIPGFTEIINNVASISIQQGDQSVKVVNTSEGWVLQNRGNYPARLDSVRQLLVSLAEMEKAERKTSDPALLADLGLGPAASPRALELRIEAADLTVVNLSFGNLSPDGRGRYVQDASDDAAWLARGVISLDPTVQAWTNTDLMRLGADFVRSIQVERPDEETFSVTRSRSGPDAAYELSPMPLGREIGMNRPMESLFSSVAFLTFTEVRPLDESVPPVPESVLNYTTTTGSTFSIRFWYETEPGEARQGWISFEFPVTDSMQSRSLAGWAFRVTPFAAEAFDVGIDELTFEVDEPQVEDGSSGPVPTDQLMPVSGPDPVEVLPLTPDPESDE